MGHLGSDPEVRETASGKKVARVSLATDSVYKNKDGNKVKNTQWHRLVAWEGTADYMNKYLQKGSHVAVIGKIAYDSFEAKDGTSRNFTEIVVDEFKSFDQSAGERVMPV